MRAGLLTLEGTSFRVQGGTLSSSAGRVATENAARWEWTGGTLSGALTLNAGATALFSGGGVKTLADGAVLNNHGTVTWTGGPLRGQTYNGTATLHNHAAGRL